ncbi:reticulon-like protein of the endoplasmic reticulum [Mortierella polycephala]|uniref:Reticulon-like protein n=1 Tax=Mortierella polycephala TaxID=41804 RepID=A0A9P6PXT4_9FUNG|nr:reticulon-like protein of the endoplasmic reticulum [Mortierella polycephala]
MEGQDHSSLDNLKVDHPVESKSDAVESILNDPTPAMRERTRSDLPGATMDRKPHSYDHSAYMAPRLRSLVLWKKPAVSGGVLAGSLSFLLMCRWVSLLNVICAFFVFGISASFIYVNGLILVGRATSNPANRPLHQYYSRSGEFLRLEANTLHRRVDYVTDGLNVVLTELAKVVLIKDNKRSLKYIGLFYAIWTLQTWFSTTTLLSLIVVVLFTAPRLYLDNRAVIDANLAKTNDLVQTHVGSSCQVAQEQLGMVYTKAENFAKGKGLLKKDDKKTE